MYSAGMITSTWTVPIGDLLAGQPKNPLAMQGQSESVWSRESLSPHQKGVDAIRYPVMAPKRLFGYITENEYQGSRARKFFSSNRICQDFVGAPIITHPLAVVVQSTPVERNTNTGETKAGVGAQGGVSKPDEPIANASKTEETGRSDEGIGSNFANMIPIWAMLLVNGTLSAIGMVAMHAAVESAVPGLSTVMPAFFDSSRVDWSWFHFTGDSGISEKIININKFGLFYTGPLFAGSDMFRVKNPYLADRLNKVTHHREIIGAVKEVAVRLGAGVADQLKSDTPHSIFVPVRAAAIATKELDAYLASTSVGSAYKKFKGHVARYGLGFIDGGVLRWTKYLAEDATDDVKFLVKFDEFMKSAPVKRFIKAVATKCKDDPAFLAEVEARTKSMANFFDLFFQQIGRYTPQTQGKVAGFALDVGFNTTLSVINSNLFSKAPQSFWKLIGPSLVLTLLVGYCNVEITQFDPRKHGLPDSAFTPNDRVLHRTIVIGSAKGMFFGGLNASAAVADGLKQFIQYAFGLWAIRYAYNLTDEIAKKDKKDTKGRSGVFARMASAIGLAGILGIDR